jgi:sarcosine oxidase
MTRIAGRSASGPTHYDVAVVGLGAIGSAALDALAAQGARAVGIDRFVPPHDRGSSHGDSRIVRRAIGEGEVYVPLVLRSESILADLEAETGQSLFERCGFLLITRDDQGTSHHGHSSFLERTRTAAERFGIVHEILSGSSIRARFPQFIGLVGDEQAYYEPGGGYALPEAFIRAFLERARRRGAQIRCNVRVEAVQPQGGGVRIDLANEAIWADRVILATGAWLPELAPSSIAPHVAVHRQVLHWFGVKDDACYRPGASPTFIWTHGLKSDQQFYGFPPINGELKVAAEQYCEPHDPDNPQPATADEGQWMAQTHVLGHLSGVTSRPVRSKACLYTATPDLDFLIDQEGDRRVLAVSACSGHGFKHAAAVGEAVANRALDNAIAIDLSPFDATRLRRTIA